MTLHLVRHGRAAAGWDADPDPGLDATGRGQALAVAARFAVLPPRPVATSPYLRCRETAQPIADRWRTVPEVVEELGEVPSPEGVPMDRRGEWLMEAMAGTWEDLGPRWTAYRDALLAAVRGLSARDAVAVTHFVAINAVIGAATGDDRVMIRSLDNCSVTVVDVLDDGSLVLLEGGDEADTIVR